VEKQAVIDSGPLIALFDKDDAHHSRSLKFVKGYNGQLFSTIAVMTEVSHLLDFSTEAQLGFLDWVIDGGVNIVELSLRDLRMIRHVTEKHSDLPADFVDASLLAIAERLTIKNVISIDGDFYVYRNTSKQYLKNLLK